MMLKTTEVLLGMALFGSVMAHNSYDKVCVGSTDSVSIPALCGGGDVSAWEVGLNCDNPFLCQADGKFYAQAAVCNFFGYNCDLCYGCGQGRTFGGTPSCRPCPPSGGGCDQACNDANLAGGCTQCGVAPGSPAPSNTTGTGPCGDLNEFLQLPLLTLLRSTDRAFCEDPDNESVGFLFLGALLDIGDVDGDGSLTCDEYQRYKQGLPPRKLYGQEDGHGGYHGKENSDHHHHHGSSKLLKPKCKLSRRGKKIFNDSYNSLPKLPGRR